eukprot:XP_001691418.1 predicted protein [Chlamydomonas reinhardtii]
MPLRGKPAQRSGALSFAMASGTRVYDECEKRYLVDVWRKVLGSGPRRHLPVPLIRPPSARAAAQRIAAAMVLLPEDWAAAAREVQAPRRDAVCGAGLC